jgi:hypothetical protein
MGGQLFHLLARVQFQGSQRTFVGI